MRARPFLVLGVAPAAIAVVLACGLDSGGLLGVDADASIDATTALDSAKPTNDAASGSIDSSDDDAFVNDDGGSASEDGASEDAAIDANDGGTDAGSCTGVVCNGACVDASTCAACDGSTLLCAPTRACGSSCTSCAGLPIQCFDCDSNRLNPVATCQPQDASAYCLNGENPGYHCGCDDDAGACPGATQTCAELNILTNVCRTCGEENTDQAPCKGGGTCDEATATCQ